MGNGINGKKVIKINNKNYTINLPRFVISFCCIILVLVIVFNIFGGKKEINANTNIDELNAKKYAKQILAEYEKDGQKDKFLQDYEKIQTSVGMYILSNSTLDDDSFTKISNDLNKDLAKDDWKIIDESRPTTWNGKWSINEQGVLKFKFDNKEIEPSWKNDSELSSKLILN